jgi:hypothetical protein
MPSKAFLTARKQGEVAQQYVATMFRKWGLTVVETLRGYHPGYDQIVSGPFYGKEVRFKAEVKYDKKAAESGNIYLDINSLRKSQASILTICLNDPIDTVLMLPLKDALEYAVKHANINGGEFNERSCLVNKDQFIREVKPKVLTTLLF